jgi:hypothetical protein
MRSVISSNLALLLVYAAYIKRWAYPSYNSSINSDESCLAPYSMLRSILCVVSIGVIVTEKVVGRKWTYFTTTIYKQPIRGVAVLMIDEHNGKVSWISLHSIENHLIVVWKLIASCRWNCGLGKLSTILEVKTQRLRIILNDAKEVSVDL